MRSRAGPAGGRSRSWKARQRLVPPRMYTARTRDWAMVLPFGGGLGEQAAGQQHVALARAQDRTQAEAHPGPPIGGPHRAARGEAAAQVLEVEHVVALDAVVVTGVLELERHDAPVDEVGAVD